MHAQLPSDADEATTNLLPAAFFFFACLGNITAGTY